MSNHDKKFSSLAIASVLLGILGSATLWIVGGLLLAAAGAVFGHLALHEIRYTGKLTGKRLAQLGLVISYLAIASFPILAIGTLASFPVIKGFQNSKVTAKSEISRTNASRLYSVCELYANSNNGKYPKDWDQLKGNFISEADLASLLQSPHPGTDGSAFALVPHQRPVLPAAASSVVVIQGQAPDSAEKIAIVHANGSVVLIGNPNRP